MTKRVKIRSLIIGICVTLSFGFLLLKIYQIQVVDAAWLQSEALKRWEDDQILVPTRGMILDRNDKVLATDATVYSISLNPKLVDANRIEDEVVQGLTGILLDSELKQDRIKLESKIRDRATKRKADGEFAVSTEIRIEGWKVDKSTADEVTALIETIKSKHQLRGNIGIVITEEKGRYYPGNTLAAHVIGYVNKEGIAAMGLEAKLDSTLRGTSGEINMNTDAKGVELIDSSRTYAPAIHGNHVRLTIDKNIQYYIENAITVINEKYKPKSISVVAVDPMTMEVLGMANRPTFDPNQYWAIENTNQFKNHAISSQYEPGSTFKLITLAGVVERGLFDPNQLYKSGSIRVPGATLHDHNRVGWGEISILEGLKRSSNVAFVSLGYVALGPDHLLDYIHKFGFGEKTNIDMYSELAGLVDMHYPSEFATATYGQGKIVTTNIQMATAYAAIANGGKLMWPHVVKEIIDSSTNQVIESFAPQVIRRVVSETTARQVSQYLEQTVSDQSIGSGRLAYIQGYRVAGKTGTANKVSEDGGGYISGQWVVSFVGFVPADNPRILISIIVDEPDLEENYHLASGVTTKAFTEIALQSLQYLGVPAYDEPINVTYQDNSTTPNSQFIGLSKKATIEKAKSLGLNLEVIGTGDQVMEQFPSSNIAIPKHQTLYVWMQPKGELILPNLVGKSKRESLELCSIVGVHCETNGQGYVLNQSPLGDTLEKKFILNLQAIRGKVMLE